VDELETDIVPHSGTAIPEGEPRTRESIDVETTDLPLSDIKRSGSLQQQGELVETLYKRTKAQV
jgi:hypothetical protein